MSTKKCSKCGDEKPLDDYRKNRRACKKCLAKQYAEWAAKNKEHRADYNSEYRLKTLDLRKAVYASWRANNIEKRKQYMAAYRQENKDKINDTTQVYREKNKEKIRALEKNREKRPYNPENLNRIKKWQNKNTAECTDYYIRRRLSYALGLTNPPQELVELKRVQLMIHREIKKGAQP